MADRSDLVSADNASDDSADNNGTAHDDDSADDDHRAADHHGTADDDGSAHHHRTTYHDGTTHDHGSADHHGGSDPYVSSRDRAADRGADPHRTGIHPAGGTADIPGSGDDSGTAVAIRRW